MSTTMYPQALANVRKEPIAKNHDVTAMGTERANCALGYRGVRGFKVRGINHIGNNIGIANMCK